MGKYYLGMEKKMQIQTPVIFDTDCLSSFLWIRRIDIIKILFPNQIIIPQTVYDELNIMRQYSRYRFVVEDLAVEITANHVFLEDILIPSNAGDEYLRLIAPNDIKQIGKGEAAAIVLAKLHNGTLASNNLRDILPHIMSGYPPYISTDTILYEYYQQGKITAKQGCEIWNAMKAKRRVLPKNDFYEVIGAFRTGNRPI